MSAYNEAAYENALIDLFTNTLGYTHVYDPDIERDWHSPLYDSVLEDSIRRLNPKVAPGAIDEALLKLRHFENAELKKKNALFMDYLQNGIEVSFSANGETKSDIIYIAAFENAEKPGDKNSYILANQWTFIENSNKRPDILLFLNGLPVCLFELKSPSREQTDASEAYTHFHVHLQLYLRNERPAYKQSRNHYKWRRPFYGMEIAMKFPAQDKRRQHGIQVLCGFYNFL